MREGTDLTVVALCHMVHQALKAIGQLGSAASVELIDPRTGAARGIGQSIANRFAANGSQVVFNDVDGDGASDAAAQVKGSVAMKVDVTKPDEINAAIDKFVAQFGRLDIVVNNADPENSYMNGHILTVDGGWTAGYTRDF